MSKLSIQIPLTQGYSKQANPVHTGLTTATIRTSTVVKGIRNRFHHAQTEFVGAEFFWHSIVMTGIYSGRLLAHF